MIFRRLKRWVIIPLIILTCLFSGVAMVGQNVYAAGDDPESSEDVCETGGGAASLGWILCPALRLLADASEKLYNDFIEPSLQIKSSTLFGSGGGAKSGWDSFRDAANILLAGLMLFVIFSQVSGLGIDNYGIKSMLPKMIAAAILVNISYWLCVAFVDLSNIVGSSLKDMFDGLSTGGGSVYGQSVDLSSGFVPTAITAAVMVGGAVFAGMSIWANPAVVLSLVISAIGAVVAIVGLFLILAARQAIIVGLVVLSPVALACYMMPNTKQVMDKWLNIFEAMLLVYPICGFLVGGGNYLSRLLLSGGFISGGDDFFKAFAASLMGIAPIFLIPSVLKSSMAAAGNIGAKIAGASQSIGGALTGAARGSSLNQAAQAAGAERKSRIAGGLKKDKDGNYVSSGSSFRKAAAVLNGGVTKRNRAQARQQFASARAAAVGRNRIMSDVGWQAASLAQSKAEDAAEVADQLALVKERTRNGADEAELNRMFDEYMGVYDEPGKPSKKSKAGAVAVAQYAGRRKDTAARFAERFTNNMGNYSGDDARSVAKEISTGDNSGNYMASNPFAFQYANDLNAGKEFRAGEGGVVSGGQTMSFDQWMNNKDNLHNVVDNYITDSGALVGMKKGELKHMEEMMQSGQMGREDAQFLQKLATETYENRANGPWSADKENEIMGIATVPIPPAGGATTVEGNATPPAGGGTAGTSETPIQTGAYSTLGNESQTSGSANSNGGGSGASTTTTPPAGGSTPVAAASPSGSSTGNNTTATPTHNVDAAINGTDGSTRLRNNGGNINDAIRGEARPGSGVNGGNSNSGPSGSIGSDGTTLDIHH